MRISLCALLVVAACTGKPKPLCTDADGDGVSAGTSPTCGGDCNDNDRAVYRTVTLFTDADGDGLGVGTGTPMCIGALVPKGFATKAGDCDDSDQHCTVDCSDNDHDGVRACDGDLNDNNPHCILTLVDKDADGYCVDHDCNDNSPLHWDDCATCVDVDGDGYGNGCDVGTSDCDDNDTDNWDACATCVDADGDQFWTGCNRYVTRSQGEDCDDTSPACTQDCQDDDADKVKACQGDCNDSRGTSIPCTLFGTGSAAQIGDVAGGAGASISIIALDSATLVGGDDALPAGTFLSGAVPPLATATSICTGPTNLKLACSAQTLNSLPSPVAGFFVPKGVTLTLHGAGPFTMTSSGDVFIGGSIVTDTPGASIVINGDGVHDFTLSGSIDTHADTCGTTCNAGNITIQGFANAALLGNINAFGAPGPGASLGGVGATITIDAANQAYFAAGIDIHSGENQNNAAPPSGGTFNLQANTVVARVNITAVGGSALGGHGGPLAHPQDPGAGGSVTLQAVNALNGSAGFNVTLLGGVATGNASTNNAGGAGGQAFVGVQNGTGAETLSSPTLVVTGGASANGMGGAGGVAQILVGNDDSTARTLSVIGRIDASGGAGALVGSVAGEVFVESQIKPAGTATPATMSVNAPIACNGDNGGLVEIGVFDATTPYVPHTPYDNQVTGADVSIAANITTTGDVAINADSLSGALTSSLTEAACDISTYTTNISSTVVFGPACTTANTAPPF